MKNMLRLDDGVCIIAGSVAGVRQDISATQLTIESGGEPVVIQCRDKVKDKADKLSAGDIVFIKAGTKGANPVAFDVKKRGRYTGKLHGEDVTVTCGTVTDISERRNGIATVVIPTTVMEDGEWTTAWNEISCDLTTSDFVFGNVMKGDRVLVAVKGSGIAEACIYI